MATREENNNTLFLIPEVKPQGEGQGKVPMRGDKALQVMREHGTSQQNIEKPQSQRQRAEKLENQGIPPHHTEDDRENEAFNDLLRHEKENVTNARIFDTDQTTDYVVEREGDSDDVSRPAKSWQWKQVTWIDVLTGDPQRIVERRMR